MVTKVWAQLWWPVGFFHCLLIVADGKSLPHSPYHLNLDTNNQDISKELTTEIIPCLNFGFLLTPPNLIPTKKKPHKINKKYLSRMKNLIASSETKTQILLFVFFSKNFLCFRICSQKLAFKNNLRVLFLIDKYEKNFCLCSQCNITLN